MHFFFHDLRKTFCRCFYNDNSCLPLTGCLVHPFRLSTYLKWLLDWSYQDHPGLKLQASNLTSRALIKMTVTGEPNSVLHNQFAIEHSISDLIYQPVYWRLESFEFHWYKLESKNIGPGKLMYRINRLAKSWPLLISFKYFIHDKYVAWTSNPATR